MFATPTTARQSLVLAAIARLAASQSSTVVTLPFYGVGSQAIDASVITVTDSVTQLALACPTTLTDYDNDCGLFPYQTLTYGPSTYNMYMSDEGFTGTQDCQVATATATTDGETGTAAAAVCAESAGGSEANFPGSSTTVYAGTEIAQIAVAVTAGAEKLGASAGASASTTAASATSTVSGASSAASEAASSGATASSQGSSTGTSVARTTSTGSTSSASAASASASASATGSSGAERLSSMWFSVFGGITFSVMGLLVL
ncbi:hypothetical protein Tdes44962_MAKER08424 [Teratosphaeria destructans]|uniref:Uncharacterized protein n=1 Tax=Teratosphaeria destructans TaxID=418781 RepID=A0A9W7W4J1_9PEZI|nr:hypothetical protein Tdes44962_MAKER08424 [Teratosphaeria destructans]